MSRSSWDTPDDHFTLCPHSFIPSLDPLSRKASSLILDMELAYAKFTAISSKYLTSFKLDPPKIFKKNISNDIVAVLYNLSLKWLFWCCCWCWFLIFFIIVPQSVWLIGPTWTSQLGGTCRRFRLKVLLSKLISTFAHLHFLRLNGKRMYSAPKAGSYFFLLIFSSLNSHHHHQGTFGNL